MKNFMLSKLLFYIIIPTLIVFLFFLNCNETDAAGADNSKISDSIFVKLSNKASANDPVFFTKGGGKVFNGDSKILVIYNDSIESKMPFEDTFKLKLIDNKTAVYLNYGLRKTEYYFPEKGDSLHITYKDGVPTIQVINNNSNWKYNVTNFIDSQLKNPVSNLDFVSLVNGRTRDRTAENSDTLKESIENYYYQYILILDSLYQEKRIGNAYHTNVKKIKKIELYNTLLSEIGSFSEKDKTEIAELLKTDSLLKYPVFRYFIKNYADFVHQISYTGKMNSQKKQSPKGFDSVLNSQEYGSKIKNYLLFFYLEDIIKSYSSDIADSYKQKFKKIESEDISQYLSIINRKYLFDKTTNLIVLKSANNHTRSLNEIIKGNKGKIIYVDFWASWCLPCRAAMPFSKKLRMEYENKDIVFIYLSIDKNLDEWKSANIQEGLKFYTHSYIIANSENSEDFKKLGVETIPRYLIYDKNGKLIYPNAPSPESSEIKNELNKLLAQ
jgi:thiol-disulfide isomerase/thioredoxin